MLKIEAKDLIAIVDVDTFAQDLAAKGTQAFALAIID